MARSSRSTSASRGNSSRRSSSGWQVAVVVERLDQEAHQRAVAVGQGEGRPAGRGVRAATRRRPGCPGVAVIVVPLRLDAPHPRWTSRCPRPRCCLPAPVRIDSPAGSAGGFLAASRQARCLGAAARRDRRRRLLALEHRILEQHALDLLVQLDRRQLQQLDRLLQLGRQREVLGEFELEAGFHRGRQEGGLRRKCSPR